MDAPQPVAPPQSLPQDLRRPVFLFFLAGAAYVALFAFVPLSEFIHRGDDAYYYFKVALNFAKTGSWTYDLINSTNGVQPLWAIILTAIAVVSGWFGVSDPDSLARLFVFTAAVFQFASCALLFVLISRMVSPFTGIVVAGAFLFPMGIVWARTWGLESPLYAFALVGTVLYFHSSFLKRPTVNSGIVLGVLLGLVALSRLNGGFLIPCMLLYFLFAKHSTPFSERFRIAVYAGAAASALLLPYFLWNYYDTGHILPVSGVVKAIATDRFLEERGIDSRFSLLFLETIQTEMGSSIARFLKSRVGDGFWIVGGRVLFGGDAASRGMVVIGLVGLFALLPFAIPARRAWPAHLMTRLGRLRPFSYFLAFGVLDALVSIFMYPRHFSYSALRWWLVDNEFIVTTASATFVAASVGFLVTNSFQPAVVRKLATATIGVLVAGHFYLMAGNYWDGEMDYHDWSLSWNDSSHRAAQWIGDNTPEDAIVGSWNAGVLGYYTPRRVVNLDGLINNFDLAPYLRERRIADYIRERGIEYLSDMERQFEDIGVLEDLAAEEVYREHSEFYQSDYVIYRVER